jgi:putative resolvase
MSPLLSWLVGYSKNYTKVNEHDRGLQLLGLLVELNAGAFKSRQKTLGVTQIMTNEKRYQGTHAVKQVLEVCGATLRQWADSGLITSFKTPGGKYRYLIDNIISGSSADSRTEEPQRPATEKLKFCSCRVSSLGQKADLDCQAQYMQSRYPEHTIIRDIGSSINFKRKGLQTILELAFRGRLEEVKVAYRVRLCRFAYELVAWIFHQHGVRLVVLNEEVGGCKAELSQDLLAIVQVFRCRVNGKRKYKRDKPQEGDQNQNPSQPEGADDPEALVWLCQEDLQHGPRSAQEAHRPQANGGLAQESLYEGL